MALDVVGNVPVLVLGDQEQLKGEIWLSNPSASEITISGASLSVTFPSGTETGVIQIPSDSAVGANASKRLFISFGIQPATPPGTYAASIDLQTSDGPQSIAASVIVGRVVLIAFGTPPQVFTSVAAGTTISSSIIVVNKGNVPFTVGDIPDEPLFEVMATPRLLTVASTGVVSVAPGTAPAPLAEKLTFTNTTPTVAVGGWAEVGVDLTTPATLPTNAHLRALARIGTERFPIDLLTT